MEFFRAHVLICGGAGCVSSGCQAVKERLEELLEKRGLQKEVKLVVTGCIGSCDIGPVMVVYPEGVFYQKVQPKDIPDIVDEHLIKGRPVTRLLYHKPDASQMVARYSDIDFFNNQVRIVLRNTGIIDPEIIEEYIARDGYAALVKAVTEMTPQQVIKELQTSGLRGRGGAGFPAGFKWQLVKDVQSDVKYVVCNADEGDPGAFMDRSLLEGDPHSIIEAMAIAAYAVGAKQGYVYVRAEYPLAVQRLSKAISQARKLNLLGTNIFGYGFDFDLDIRVGAGAFVCGEETALMQSIEGKRGEPISKPPYPSDKGLFGKPTLINNVETYANVVPIILKGANWFNQFGTDKSKGTKVFAVAGNTNNTGLVEVELGTTLRTLVFDICGGIPAGKEFKAVQIGGPSGGCLTSQHLDAPIDYDSLVSLGAMMGSGGLIVMDEDTCMVDIARYFLDFTQDESCGKCTPCRIGTKRMLEILERITQGKGEASDINKLKILANGITDTALCGLGKSAAKPVLSTLRYFLHEYEAHINEKYCPAGVCQQLATIKILPDQCRSCGICARACPTNAIVGEPGGETYVIDQDSCSRCGACIDKCPFTAIVKY